MADILVVDDDQAVATAFEQFLVYDGHTCRLASNADAAGRSIEERRPDIVLMDIRMPGVDGLTALNQLRERFPGLCVIMMTAYGTSQTSIDAIRAGAFDYLTKPLDLDQLRGVIEKALEAQRVVASSREPEPEGPPVTLVGETPQMLDVYKMIGRLATNNVPALVVGERGSGKRLVVSTIHANSKRHDAALILFHGGTGTDDELARALDAAQSGTLAIIDVDRLSSSQQTTIASALEAARTPGGASRAGARIVATAEHDVADDVRAGTFSRPLFDELAVITLDLPPLRERRDDVPLLVRHFIQRFNGDLSRSIRGVDEQVAKMLRGHAWPGNVAELERVVKRACIVTRSDVITQDEVADALVDSRFSTRPDVESALERAVRDALHDRLVNAKAPAPSPYHQILDIVETTLVREALSITNGNQVKAAEILGVNRATLRKKMPLEG